MALDLLVFRNVHSPAAVLFIHGFSGQAETTWGGFPRLIAEDPALADYDVYAWGYPSELKLTYLFTQPFWTGDPNLHTLGQGLRTLLDHTLPDYPKLVLVGHSMGGLVIQSFILEELLLQERLAKPSLRLRRLKEVVLFGTPSAGLKKARLGAFFKNQIADMNDYGPFIQTLRSEWQRLIDNCRAAPLPGVDFRLTLVAGLQDTFVPQQSALDPFLWDEKELVPGDHIAMVKPASREALAYRVLKKRLQREAPSAQAQALLYGRDAQALQTIHRIQAAVDLGDTDDLKALAKAWLAAPPRWPKVERALGLALLGQSEYALAATLLTRYLDFKWPGTETPPFRDDAEAVQQLAIALSGAGDYRGALARLNDLDPQVRNLSETLGIYAGRLKRHWQATHSPNVGQRARQLYTTAFEAAQKVADRDQALYNGINAAYLGFALGAPDFSDLARAVLGLCQTHLQPHYWSTVSGAEAQLLLGEYAAATQAYRSALGYAPPHRHLDTTGRQAQDILARQGHPAAAEELTALLAQFFIQSS
jgi:pimeloyl-ACP methyl ester carboxylesterase